MTTVPAGALSATSFVSHMPVGRCSERMGNVPSSPINSHRLTPASFVNEPQTEKSTSKPEDATEERESNSCLPALAGASVGDVAPCPD
jgi:hypothetical protein